MAFIQFSLEGSRQGEVSPVQHRCVAVEQTTRMRQDRNDIGLGAVVELNPAKGSVAPTSPWIGEQRWSNLTEALARYESDRSRYGGSIASPLAVA